MKKHIKHSLGWHDGIELYYLTVNPEYEAYENAIKTFVKHEKLHSIQ